MLPPGLLAAVRRRASKLGQALWTAARARGRFPAAVPALVLDLNQRVGALKQGQCKSSERVHATGSNWKTRASFAPRVK